MFGYSSLSLLFVSVVLFLFDHFFGGGGGGCAVLYGFFFFFQAEDGIRDLVRSRGLGDVYKRQVIILRPILLSEAYHPILQILSTLWETSFRHL